MEHRLANTVHKDEATGARSLKARKYARNTGFVLAGLCLAAIWQEERLAPPVHNGMQVVTAYAMGYVNESETLSEALVQLQDSYAEFTSDG